MPPPPWAPTARKALRALYDLAGRERDSVWFRALLLRLMPVDGRVVDKIRYNKSMQLIPPAGWASGLGLYCSTSS